MGLFKLLPSIISSTSLAKWNLQVARIDAREPALQKLTDSELRKESLSLRYEALSGVPLEQLLVPAYALVREAGRRTLGMRHYKVQLLGGMAIHHGCIAEMQTGEGKTLTATAPMYLASLHGKGAHLATANDYLAARDAELMRPVYELLGVSVGIVEAQTPRPERQSAYQCDVTYTTAKELGFDFLRDRLLLRQNEEGFTSSIASMLGHIGNSSKNEYVLRDLNFALIDEADSLLIDEAKTPLIVSAASQNSASTMAALYKWCAKVANEFQSNTHYEFSDKPRRVTLNSDGRQRLRELSKPDSIDAVTMIDMYENLERAILVNREYQKDRHYVIDEGEVVIVDEFTGRIAEGRKWKAGIHQAIEAREGLEVSTETGDAARVTLQEFFLRYDRLSGMTGTIANSAPELKKIYKVDVIKVPTNRPPQRKQLTDLVFGNAESKWKAIVSEAAELHKSGRPVLIGTRTIDKSEHLSKLLDDAGIAHEVLNARHVAREAEIVAKAGEKGRVTVATNMAGRGTDIQLTDEIRELGGMHVICSELHESARIDRQLIGRCGRQGDPGSYRIFMALDDDLLNMAFGHQKAEKYKRLGKSKNGPIRGMSQIFYRAQMKIERDNFKGRRMLLHQERERRKSQTRMGQDPFLDTVE